MGSLDDAFADFLKEVGGEEEATALGTTIATETIESADATEEPPKPKRARRDEACPSSSRSETAQALRRSAYRGDARAADELLARLPVVERLLLIDDLDPDDGFAALHLAVIRGHMDVAKKLVARRADVDVLTQDGETPLMWAAHLGSMAACKELLRHGADASFKNRARTAATQARAAGHRRVYEMLENHACDVTLGLRRGAMSKERAAAARRAANAAMVEQSLREAKEQEDDEVFWAGVRARRENREATGKNSDSDAHAAYAAARAEATRAEAAKRAAEEAALAGLPASMRPHFLTLELPHDATELEVRRAYRQFALRHHPDKNPKDAAAAKERFTAGAVAYEAICEYLASAEGGGGGGGGGGARVAPPSSY